MTVITWTIMRLGFAKSAVSVLTAVSLTLAMMISVFAQSHTMNEGAAATADPCVGHQVPATTPVWEEACAALCDTPSLDNFVAAATDRLKSVELQVLSVSYALSSPHRTLQTSRVCFITTHDPPGSRLYLTTQRLRI